MTKMVLIMTFSYIIMTKNPAFMIIMIFCTQLLTNVIPCAIMPSHSIEGIEYTEDIYGKQHKQYTYTFSCYLNRKVPAAISMYFHLEYFHTKW